jgi:16S rRNA (cytidine1402-2'-O)-methyltransferase
MEEEPATASLYVVATPIGNLRDVTLRALDVLAAVDLIAAEDTRVTARLLAHHGIDRPMLAVHEHNEQRAAHQVVAALAAGRSVALVSDAGTPGVSDPGAAVVAAVRAAGHRIVAVPGPSALAAAWSVAGFTAAQLYFCGFLPVRAGDRKRAIEAVAGLTCALVFYEAPHRIVECIRALAQELGGERRVVIARELTKLFESVHATSLGEAGDWLETDADRRRGEFVLVVEGARAPKGGDAALGERALRELLTELAPSQAARLAARISGVPRAALYELALAARQNE